MVVHIKHIGCANRPVDGISRFFHLYWMEARNGAVALEEDEEMIDDGDYDLPDKDWTYDDTNEYGEELVNEEDLLGSTTA